VPDWTGLLSSDLAVKEINVLRRHERTGRPLGSDGLVTGLERLMSRILEKKKPGSKTKQLSMESPELFPERLEGPSLAGAICLLPHGGTISDCCCPVH
jgi:hypothetical protein